MKREKIQHHMDGLLLLLLFGVFAVCVLSVLLTGAKAYRRLTLRDQEAYRRRTCVQYIATRVRQGDVEGGVSVEPFGGGDALVMTGDGYVTRVYCYNGWLMEMYAGEDVQLAPEDGERIMELDGLAMSMDGGLLTVEVDGGDAGMDTLRLSLRSGEGGAE